MSKLDFSDRITDAQNQISRAQVHADALTKAQTRAEPAAKAAALSARAVEIYQFADKLQGDILALGGDPQPVVAPLMGIGDRERTQAEALLSQADGA